MLLFLSFFLFPFFPFFLFFFFFLFSFFAASLKVPPGANRPLCPPTVRHWTPPPPLYTPPLPLFLLFFLLLLVQICDRNNCFFSQLRDAFVQQMTQGFSHNDRQLRNDLIVIASLISSICADAPFVDTGFAKHIALFATFQEGRMWNWNSLGIFISHSSSSSSSLIFPRYC